MDSLSKELQSFLVRMGLYPESIDHKTMHEMRHLLALLLPQTENAIINYFGLFGEEQLSLHEIAVDSNVSDEKMLQMIDISIRKLAVTPEWQLIKQSDKLRQNKNNK